MKQPTASANISLDIAPDRTIGPEISVFLKPLGGFSSFSKYLLILMGRIRISFYLRFGNLEFKFYSIYKTIESLGINEAAYSKRQYPWILLPTEQSDLKYQFSLTVWRIF